MASSSTASNGIGFYGILCIVFIILKLMDVIDWSWWWVLLPAYGPSVFLFGIAVVAFCIWCIIQVVAWCIQTRKKK